MTDKNSNDKKSKSHFSEDVTKPLKNQAVNPKSSRYGMAVNSECFPEQGTETVNTAPVSWTSDEQENQGYIMETDQGEEVEFNPFYLCIRLKRALGA